MKRRIMWTLGLASFLVGFVAVALTAQTARANTSMEDLLAEVKGLRAELRQASSASIRTQLLTARLQLQEQRLYAASQQLTEVQAKLANARQEILTAEDRAARLEKMDAPLETLNELRREAAQVRRLAEIQQGRVEELTRQEADLVNSVNVETARWTEFNGRLDEIERTLPSRR